MDKKRILVIGSGGREHTIGWKLSLSPLVGELFFAPGNGGTSALGENVPLKAEDREGLLKWAKEKKPDITIVGPEIPLSLGIVDLFQKNNLSIFGPTTKAAEIETSKAYAKYFMNKYNIPTAKFAVFDTSKKAHAYADSVAYPVVVKASGLAAGKGVLVPENRDETHAAIDRVLVQKEFRDAGDEVVIEERLKGEEVSVLVFTDGKTIALMPPTQDHKRLLDHDRGPNTGGMGAYAPTPLCTKEQLAQIKELAVMPAISGLKKEGRQFVGVLYAGLMLTKEGPKVLEFNCRLGDPETQVILPLLETDLVEIIEACVKGNLDKLKIRWKKASALGVVLAAKGYPGDYQKGMGISGIGRATEFSGVYAFHAGTAQKNGSLISSGGRVLTITAVGTTLEQAHDNAYGAVARVSFDGIQYRTDIGKKVLT